MQVPGETSRSTYHNILRVRKSIDSTYYFSLKNRYIILFGISFGNKIVPTLIQIFNSSAIIRADLEIGQLPIDHFQYGLGIADQWNSAMLKGIEFRHIYVDKPNVGILEGRFGNGR